METLLSLAFFNTTTLNINLLCALLFSLALLNHTFCTEVFKKSSTEWAHPRKWILAMGLITLIIAAFSFVLYTLTYSVFLSFFSPAWISSLSVFSKKMALPLLFFVPIHIISLYLAQKAMKNTSPTLSQALEAFLPLLFIQSTLLTDTFFYLTHATADLLVVLERTIGVIAGFTLILVIFDTIAERLKTTSVPIVLKGTAIHLLTLGILSLALVSISGTL